MPSPEITSMIAAVLAGTAAIVTAISTAVGVHSRKKLSNDVQAIHISINSRMDQLLQARAEASNAEGVAQGRRELHEERKATEP